MGDWTKYKNDRISPIQDCIYRMLTGKIWDGTHPKPLVTFISDAASGKEELRGRANNTLAQNGFKVTCEGSAHFLHVAHSDYWPVQDFFEKRSVVSYWDILKNLKGVTADKKIKYVGKAVVSLTIPFKALGLGED